MHIDSIYKGQPLTGQMKTMDFKQPSNKRLDFMKRAEAAADDLRNLDKRSYY